MALVWRRGMYCDNCAARTDSMRHRNLVAEADFCWRSRSGEGGRRRRWQGGQRLKVIVD
jgi:hypothetical protein